MEKHLQPDFSLCLKPDDANSLCVLCVRNFEDTKERFVTPFKPEIVEDELVCKGFVVTEIYTKKVSKEIK